MVQNMIKLENMYDKITSLKHKHAKGTVEQYHVLVGQSRRPIISTNTTHNTNIKIKEEGSSSDPFM